MRNVSYDDFAGQFCFAGGVVPCCRFRAPFRSVTYNDLRGYEITPLSQFQVLIRQALWICSYYNRAQERVAL